MSYMTDEEKNRIGIIMLQALRAVAAGKGDYGRDFTKPSEYREVAKKALQDINCY